MNFSGFVSSMANSLRGNRDAMKAGKKTPFDKDGIIAAKGGKWVDPVQLSAEEQAKLYESIRLQSKLEKKRELIVLLIAVSLGLIVLRSY